MNAIRETNLSAKFPPRQQSLELNTIKAMIYKIIARNAPLKTLLISHFNTLFSGSDMKRKLFSK